MIVNIKKLLAVYIPGSKRWYFNVSTNFVSGFIAACLQELYCFANLVLTSHIIHGDV